MLFMVCRLFLCVFRQEPYFEIYFDKKASARKDYMTVCFNRCATINNKHHNYQNRWLHSPQVESNYVHMYHDHCMVSNTDIIDLRYALRQDMFWKHAMIVRDCTSKKSLFTYSPFDSIQCDSNISVKPMVTKSNSFMMDNITFLFCRKDLINNSCCVIIYLRNIMVLI